MFDDSSKQWKRWGDDDPWYGVLSEPRYRQGLDRQAFFGSGQEYWDHIILMCSELGLYFEPNSRVLEFGCGVGRVLIPMAKQFPKPVGVDISPGMLAEAKIQLDEYPADLFLASGRHPLPIPENQKFEIVHSALVFQHIPARRGIKILQSLLQALAPGGVAIIQAPYRTDQPLRYSLNRLRASHQILFDFSRLLMGRLAELGAPVMQMNIYSPEAIQTVAQAAGTTVRWVEQTVDDYDYLQLATWYITK